MDTKRRTDWLKVIATTGSIILSIVIAAGLTAAKELFQLKIGLTTAMLISLHILPSVVYYFRYIRGNTIHWKRNTMFLTLFLIAQVVMGVGIFVFRSINGETLTTAFGYAILGVLFVKLTLLGTVVVPPFIDLAEKILGLITAAILAVVWLLQCIVTVLLILIISPTITAAIHNAINTKIGLKIKLPFDIFNE